MPVRPAFVVVVVVLLLVVALNVRAEPSAAERQGLDAAAQPMIDKGRLRSAVIGLVDRTGARVHAYGRLTAAPGAPAPTGDTVYEIASVTKMVTAMLAFRLIEQGRLSLDDTLADFHPEMPSAGQITLRQMLAHTSGLGNFAIKDGKVWIVAPLAPSAIQRPLLPWALREPPVRV